MTRQGRSKMVENVRLVSAQVVSEVLRYDDLIPAIESALGKFSNRPESGIIQPVRTILPVKAVDGYVSIFFSPPLSPPVYFFFSMLRRVTDRGKKGSNFQTYFGQKHIFLMCVVV